MAKNIVIANWKMNPDKSSIAQKLFQDITKKAAKYKKIEVVIAPPYIFLPAAFKKNKAASLGAQDAFWGETGSSTGEISSRMLKNIGVSHVIVGHSERRAIGESNELIAKKLRGVLKEDMAPILCIGERERDGGAKYLSFLTDQLTTAFFGISKKDVLQTIIAYEPIWAIGKSAQEAMDAHKLYEMTIFIQKVLTSLYGREVASKARIIYGGSVEESNAENLLKNGNISGFLVGRGSLDAQSFDEILSVVEKGKK